MLGMQNFAQTFSIIFLVCNNQKRAKPQTVQRNSSFIVLLYLLNGSLSWKASSKAQTNSTLPGDYQALSQIHTNTHTHWVKQAESQHVTRCTFFIEALYTQRSHIFIGLLREQVMELCTCPMWLFTSQDGAKYFPEWSSGRHYIHCF